MYIDCEILSLALKSRKYENVIKKVMITELGKKILGNA